MATETGKFKLLCLENPLLDIQGEGDDELIQKYGLKMNDTILTEDKNLGLYDELIQNRNAKLIAGGAAQNIARGVSYCLPPSSVWYIGCVGKDKYADQLTEACKKEGVHTEYRIDEKEPTGRCGVVIIGKERTMCTNLAAANEYKVDHLVQPRIWSMVEATPFFYVGGYHLTVSPPAIMKLAEEAAAKDKPFMLGLSAGFIPEFFKDQLAEVLPYIDYIFGNENEAITWAKSQGHSTTDVAEAAKLMAKMPKKNQKRPRTVIFTQGKEPTITAVANADGEVDVKQYPVHVIEEDLINDTNGAGDAFCGGFIAGIIEGKSLQQCVDQGQWLAYLSIQELGPSYPFPKQTYQAK